MGIRLMYASLVSPTGWRGTKYQDVVLKEHVRKFIRDLKKEIYEDDYLGYKNKKTLLHYSKIIDKLAGKEFVISEVSD